MEYWWSSFRKRIDIANGENYRLQKELAFENFTELLLHFQSQERAKELCDMMVEHWCNPPIYDDAKSSMENIQFPVYFVTNIWNIRKLKLNITAKDRDKYRLKSDICLFSFFNSSDDLRKLFSVS